MDAPLKKRTNINSFVEALASMPQLTTLQIGDENSDRWSPHLKFIYPASTPSDSPRAIPLLKQLILDPILYSTCLELFAVLDFPNLSDLSLCCITEKEFDEEDARSFLLNFRDLSGRLLRSFSPMTILHIRVSDDNDDDYNGDYAPVYE